jgi:hypothetical protein
MRSAKNVGRIIGLALLIQLLLALPVYFVWMRPVTGTSFLENAAGSALQIRFALLVTFVLGAMTFTAAIMAMPVFRRYSERLALAFLALSIVGLATLAMESMSMRNMLSLSLEYAKAGAANDLLQTLGGLARSTAVGAHHTNLMVVHGTVLLPTSSCTASPWCRALPFGMAAPAFDCSGDIAFSISPRLPAGHGWPWQSRLALWLIVRFEEQSFVATERVDGLPRIQ